MAAKPNPRTKKVVNARVQWTLASRVILHFFVFVCAGAVFGLINQFLVNPFGGAANNLMTFWKQSGPMLVALICLMPVFIRDTLTLSNKIAGPIYNLRRTCERLASGEPDVPALKFRKGDMWADLPESFNHMVETLRSGSPGSNVPSTSVDEESLEDADHELATV
ncbi:MAG: hypothetical protein R3C49_23325 [Planctomycetaceae bacterium]